MGSGVSLAIPARDEERSIGQLLESVMAQRKLPDEVIITDAGSKDNTVKIAESYAVKGCPVVVIRAGEAYPGKARNVAIQNSAGPIIALTDAGVTLNTIWLSELLKKMEADSSVDVVFGVFEPRSDTLFKKYSSIAFAPKKRLIDGKKIRTFSVASMLLKKKVWESVGGFPDLRSTEDKIFLEKIKSGGYKTAFAPEAVATWDVPGTPGELFSKFYLYSYHGIKAGRMKDWHIPVIRIYIILSVLALLGLFVSPVFFWGIAILICARAFRLILNKTECGIWKKLDPLQFVYVLFSMELIDVALFCGMVKYAIIENINRNTIE